MASPKFWNRVAEKYAKQPVRDQKAYDQTIARVKERLTPNDRVLEVGCGTGTTALRLADSVAHLRATDISENMIEIAQQKSSEAGAQNVVFAKGEIFDETATGEPYDAVLAFNFLHLLENAEEGLAHARQLLKPEGYFISKTMCIREMNFFFPLMIRAMRLVGKAPYVRYFSRSELEQMIADAGFEVLETAGYPHPNRFVVARKI